MFSTSEAKTAPANYVPQVATAARKVNGEVFPRQIIGTCSPSAAILDGQAQEALRNLSGRLIRAQEDERRRVARELHDDFNQRLAILAIELAQLEQKLPKDREDLRVSVTSIRTKTHEISSDIHRLSYQLHPAQLDHLGLEASIKSLCEEISRRHEIDIEFNGKGFPAALPEEVTLCIYRVAQEGLRNVIRHSGARTARVGLEKSNKGIHLHVSDTGCGFDIGSPRTQTGLGLISMRERLRLVGGTILIRSRPLFGTEIDVFVTDGADQFSSERIDNKIV